MSGILATPAVSLTTGLNIYSTQTANTTIEEVVTSVSGESTGAEFPAPHNNMMSYLGMNYVIAIIGVYPSRN